MEDIRLVKNYLDKDKADWYYTYLERNVNWISNLSTIDGNVPIRIKRSMAYMSDTPVMYKYANLQFQGILWDEEIKDLNYTLSLDLGYKFNSVLLNKYKNGKETINWHSDNEESLGDSPVIACINLGASRNFSFRSKEEDSVPFHYEVNHGDLLVMGEECQRKYKHAILKDSSVTESRISLTFRFNHV